MASSTFFSAFLFLFLVLQALKEGANGSLLDDGKTRMLIENANKKGPYLGVVIPNMFEMNPLLEHSSYKPSTLIIDYAGRRFRFGTIEGKPVILVMTGLAMLNAGITTQLLLSVFDVYGVVHYGIAGNANPSLNIGDVAIPQYWSHTALWNWQRYGDGPENELPLEVNGDYTREIGFIKFAKYATNVDECNSQDNLLNNVWYQPEEIFPVDATPEERQHIFWVPVDSHYFQIAQSLEGLELEGCINATTCLTHTPKVTRVERGTSASIYLDNAAYRSFIYDKFNVSPVEMESAAVALVCHQQKVPYIIIRALSDLAGGGSAESNEAATFIDLAADNSVKVAVEFIKKVPSPNRSAGLISSF
ncbi:PREDICTED: bark storage protein A-like [Ipomoea nil]|uniref:bark storage protein A-like n=1 Tax=Ipomoea nil TaxID=35883 RepID=UPI000901562E|nr:PREDICTED: bark storage protein A-like [Ipomoea nil]